MNVREYYGNFMLELLGEVLEVKILLERYYNMVFGGQLFSRMKRSMQKLMMFSKGYFYPMA